MKISEVGIDNGYAIVRGWVSPNGAAPEVLIGGITDGATSTDAPATLEFAGLTVTDLGSGVTLVASSWKVPVRCATVSAGTLATSFAAGQVLDGITLATSDRILIKDQASASENGIYTVNATGAPSRSLDTGLSALVLGAVVYVVSGTANAGAVFACSNTTAPVLDTDAITWVRINSGGGGGGGGGTGAASWFNVRDYGAVGDGTTDDTVAINLAIAALVAAGKGVLYFPAGTYKVTSALTTLSVPCLVLGDGQGDFGNTGTVSRINFTSATARLFYVTTQYARFEKLALVNTYAGTPSAGTGIYVDGANISAKCDIESVSVQGFYDNIRVGQSAQFFMHGVYCIGPVRYGLNLTAAVNADSGDFSISDSFFYSQTYSATAGIFVDAISGMKVTNCKFNIGHDSHPWTDDVRIAVPNGYTISVFDFTGNSFEGYSSHGISITTAGTGTIVNGTIVGNEFADSSLSTSPAIYMNAASSSEIRNFTIAGNVGWDGLGLSGAFVSLTNCDSIYVGANETVGFSSALSQTTCTNVVDDTGSIAAGVRITGTPSSGNVPIASSGTAAAWGAPAGTLTVKDEGTPLATVATSIDFVGAGVTASGSTAAKTVTIPDNTLNGVTLSGTPSTGQVPTATGTTTATWQTPASSSSSGTADHAHIDNVLFSGDASTTVFNLPTAPVDAFSIQAFVAGVLTAVTLSGTTLTTATFGSAPASGTDNVRFDIAALVEA